MQLRDLSAILESTHEHRLGPLEKISTVSEYAFGDLVGVLMLLGVLLAVLRTADCLVGRSAGCQPAKTPNADVAVGGPAGWTAGGPRILWWCLAIVVVFAAWLPDAYPLYDLLVIPALCIVADNGYRRLLQLRWRRPSGPPTV
jgi:hypothetical protein